MTNKNLDKAIESICYKGCTFVNSVIVTLENGKPVDEAENLSQEEITILIKELKGIMAVYNEQP